MGLLRLYTPDMERLIGDIDYQVKKLEFELTITKNLIGILKQANERKENKNHDSRGSDPLGSSGTERENTV